MLTALGSSVLTMTRTTVSTRVLGVLKSVAYETLVQTAIFTAVDNISDVVFTKDVNGDETEAELALDLLLTIYLSRKGFGALSSCRARSKTIRQTDSNKRSRFVSSLGSTPFLVFKNSAAIAQSITSSARLATQWFWHEGLQVLSLFGINSGRFYGSVSAKGLMIPGVSKLPNVKVGAVGGKELFALSGFTAAGLATLSDSVIAINREIGNVSSKDLRPVDYDLENDKLSFLRDPDSWLDSFGSVDTPGGVLVDRAIHWLLNDDPSSTLTVIADDLSEDESAVAREIAKMMPDDSDSTDVMERVRAMNDLIGHPVNDAFKVFLDHIFNNFYGDDVAKSKLQGVWETLGLSDSLDEHQSSNIAVSMSSSGIAGIGGRSVVRPAKSEKPSADADHTNSANSESSALSML